MKVYDGFIFNDELDLLELRLKTLDAVVDHHIAVCGDRTFMGNPKEFFGRLSARVGGKLSVIPQPLDLAPHPAMEHQQRRGIARAFADAAPEDLLIISDVDEIPDPKVLLALRNDPHDYPVTLEQDLYYYTANWKQASPWAGPVVVPRGVLGAEIDCQKIREDRHHFPKIAHGGWHFSWFGSSDQIAAKLRALDVDADARLYGTPEIAKPDPSDKEHLQNCIDTGADLFRRTQAYAAKTWVPIQPGVTHPERIVEWLRDRPQYATAQPQVEYR